jgi:hypothetical protein
MLQLISYRPTMFIAQTNGQNEFQVHRQISSIKLSEGYIWSCGNNGNFESTCHYSVSFTASSFFTAVLKP